MQFPRLISVGRQLLSMLLAGTLIAPAWAQEPVQQSATAQSQATTSASTPAAAPRSQAFDFSSYSKPYSHFPNPFKPYLPHHVEPPNLSNTPRIDQLMQNGKLMLTVNDAIALALENNLDIAIARYNLPIADTDIVLANSGQATRGVNTGVVQGTPGGIPSSTSTSTTGTTGSQGGGAGGTTAGAGGAGTGAAGLVTSTLGVGAPVPSFDPNLTGTLQLDRSQIQSSSAFAGIPITSQNTGTVNFAYNQGFHWGSTLSVGFNNSRVTTNSPFTVVSPTLNSGFRATISQPLLQGLGFLSNTRFIRIAKNNREISDVAFRLQVITTVNQIQNIYWDLVNAYENVKVQEEALALANKTLSDNQKQVQIGTLAPIEIVRAQSVVATDQQQLTLARTNLELQQLLMKNALSRTLVDPMLAGAEVIPTSVMALPEQEPVTPIQDLVNDAISHRAELAQSRIDLVNRDINNKSAKNALLPTLNAFGYYGGSGLGGRVSETAQFCGPSTTSTFCVNPASVPPQFLGSGTSYGGTVGQLFDSTAPDKGVGLQLTIPIRNRAAQANQVRAELEYRQSQMRLQQLENQVRIEVRNAQFALQQNRASVAAARAAVALAQESFDAESKKYALGASTSTLVLQQQSALTQARSTLVSAMSSYEKSRIELDRATGLTLSKLGIDIADAERGQVNHMPNVPYVAPRQDQPSTSTPGQAAPGTVQATPQSIPSTAPRQPEQPPAPQPPQAAPPQQ
jgi:outer membrane protein